MTDDFRNHNVGTLEEDRVSVSLRFGAAPGEWSKFLADMCGPGENLPTEWNSFWRKAVLQMVWSTKRHGNGKPLSTLRIPFHGQALVRLSSTPVALPPHRCPGPNGS
jgi:hypothetical protein